MDDMTSAIVLSRIQFAVTSLFHITWPLLTIGFSLLIVLFESIWLRTGQEIYYRHARFWTRLLILNFGIGVASGVPMQFQIGMNWAPFSYISGDFVGNILGYEAAMAFMLEAGFLGIMVFGWKRVTRGMHLFASCMVAFGASLSAFWIMTANSWMQTPTGVVWNNGRLYVEDYWAAIFNPNMPWGVSHMWLACLETSVFVLGGVSAYYLLKNRFTEFYLKSFKVAMLGAVVIAPLQVLVGHESGLNIGEHQPAKLAASEGHWETNPPGQGAPWVVLAWPDSENERNRWQLAIPNLLSIITTNSLTGEVKGLKDIPRDQRPSVGWTFYSLRIMVAIGFFLAALAVWTAVAWFKRRRAPEQITQRRWLLWAWVFAGPLGFIATYAGWITREVGRQPWTIYGLLRTDRAVSVLPVETVATSLAFFVLIYLGLFIGFIVFARRMVMRGPDLVSPLPDVSQLQPLADLGIRHDKPKRGER
jgi:cytochrome bd ubiquinol oxidase subunit I